MSHLEFPNSVRVRAGQGEAGGKRERASTACWGAHEVSQELAASAKMGRKGSETLDCRVVRKARSPGRGNRRGKGPGTGSCGPHTGPSKASPWLKPKGSEEVSGRAPAPAVGLPWEGHGSPWKFPSGRLCEGHGGQFPPRAGRRGDHRGVPAGQHGTCQQTVRRKHAFPFLVFRPENVTRIGQVTQPSRLDNGPPSTAILNLCAVMARGAAWRNRAPSKLASSSP